VNDVTKRSVATERVGFPPGIEAGAFIHRVTIEVRVDSRVPQLIEDVALVAPVLQPLQIRVETRPDRPVPLSHDDVPASAGQDDSADKPSGTGADNRHRHIVVLISAPMVISGYHSRQPHVSRTYAPGAWYMAACTSRGALMLGGSTRLLEPRTVQSCPHGLCLPRILSAWEGRHRTAA
jgi:hypothetical protein